MRSITSRGHVAAPGAALVAALLAAIPASASPATWERFPLTCGQSTFAVTSPPGFWSVGIVLDGAPGQHIVSYAYTITVTDLTTGEVLYANGSTKPGTRGQESLDCSDVTLTTDPDTGDSISIDFQTTVFLPGGTGER